MVEVVSRLIAANLFIKHVFYCLYFLFLLNSADLSLLRQSAGLLIFITWAELRWLEVRLLVRTPVILSFSNSFAGGNYHCISFFWSFHFTCPMFAFTVPVTAVLFLYFIVFTFYITCTFYKGKGYFIVLQSVTTLRL